MFSPAPMLRLSAVVLDRDEREVLTTLGRMGVMQLTRLPAGGETPGLAVRDLTAEIGRYERLRARIEEIRRLLEISGPAGSEPPGEVDLSEAEEKLGSIEEHIGEASNLRRAYRQRQRDLTALCDQVSDWRGLDVPLAGPDHFSFLHFVTGSLPEQNLEGVRAALGDNVALVPLQAQKGRRQVIAMTTRENSGPLEELLQGAGFQREVLPEVEGHTADTLCAEKEKEHDRLGKELARLDIRLKSLADEFAPYLNGLEAAIGAELGFLRAQQELARTDTTTLITGWVPAHEAATVGERLGKITGGRCAIEVAAPDEAGEEKVPTLLAHSALLRPFGMLMSSYGTPNYRELEPTIFVAVSYVLMFGIMFGDWGHGATLAALGVAALLKGKTGKARDVGVLLTACGLSSVVFGLIYGSFFGLEHFKRYAFWHDPLEGDPMGLMYGAIAVGVVMISLGLILNAINRFRRGDVIGGFLDKFGVAGIVFYWGVLAMIVGQDAISSRGLMGAALVVFLVLPALCWIIKEPLEYFLHRSGEHGTLGVAITESFVGAFEAFLSYLANTISFVRLGAYAMSHAALLVAAFMLAEQVKHLPVAGTVGGVVVVILGNLVAIVLEGIIASVQALRLEYYEFFGKFYSGDGQAFEPFRLAGKTGLRES
ncbi:MAG: V-type ATP synthase subunit I [Syntrophorhabdus sp. PtaB.Bin047]|nr:MAG: V-type ATP synthase subunit I [Syntrophorhabdus sp. PtaB.Bin047]